MKKLGEYENGNYKVIIMQDGTKIRFTQEDEYLPEKPESMDLKITNRCTGTNCAFCFTGDTKVSLLKETKPISEIEAGEEVWSYNFLEKKKELKKVVRTYKRPNSQLLYKITLADGKSVVCTPNHKIFTNQGWKRADQLEVGTIVYKG